MEEGSLMAAEKTKTELYTDVGRTVKAEVRGGWITLTDKGDGDMVIISEHDLEKFIEEYNRVKKEV